MRSFPELDLFFSLKFIGSPFSQYNLIICKSLLPTEI